MDGRSLLQAKEILADIRSLCDAFGLYSLGKTVRSVNSFAEQNQYIDVAVLGQFKAGKSSFLNGLLNHPLLPVGDIPVTSVISRLRFGATEKATVTFLDGTAREVPIDAISEYVSESGNPENTKHVMVVDIETPQLSSVKALRLVDTPGLGSVWKHNTETTMEWFPETGGVLFIISAEKPISEHELQLLQEVYRYSPQITLVISKCDLFPEEHLQKVEKFTADVLKSAFDRDFPIIRYSARVGTQDYNSRLHREVFQPLAQNRDATYASILRYKISTLVDSCLSYLEIAYRTSLQQENQKNRIRDAIIDEHLNGPFIRRELLLIIGSYKGKTRESVFEYLNSFRPDLEARLKVDYEKAFPAWKGNLYSLSRQYEDWLNQALGSELKAILLSEEKSFELLISVKKHLSFYLKSFRERLSHNLLEVLGVEAKIEELDITVGDLKKPDISISRSFDSHLDLLWFLFPMFLFRGVFHRYFYKLIAGELEKNIHRLTSGLTERINKEMDNLMAQALSYMNDEVRMIENLLVESKGGSDYILGKINDVKNKFERL